MITSFDIRQIPPPGTRQVYFCGDVVSFRLFAPENSRGTAWIRTNLGQGKAVRTETIREVSHGSVPLGRDWFDIPMHFKGKDLFEVRLGLHQVGHFEAKCFFLPDGADEPVWAPGENVEINVSSADTCCANSIYNAFVRQFGPNRHGGFFDDESASHTGSLDQRGFTVIPPSGTFRDLIRELDFIVDTLGCRIIQLLPVNPTPTTYGRMGRFGSPYASLGFTAVDPSLAEFDPRATPLEQFSELVDAVHARGAKLFLDLAVNHTGWAAGIHESHPEWLVRDDRGTIETPGAWGVVWADLTRLDYRRRDLWIYMGEVFLQWCRRGVDGFRCDAGYMIPRPAWQYMIARVREQYPDTVFFLEGLGGKISVTRQLLNRGNFDWTYSELFQNYDRGQIESYLPEAIDISEKEGLTVHFAETHDNNRLAERSHRFARMRTALCALLSSCGAWGFANGVEWLAREKIDVHGSPSLNWGAAENQVDEIRVINFLMKHHPAFFDQTRIRMAAQGEGNSLAVVRHHNPTGEEVLIVANLDDTVAQPVAWNRKIFPIPDEPLIDLLTDRRIHPNTTDEHGTLMLDPGAVFCLSRKPFQPPGGGAFPESRRGNLPPRIVLQQLRALVLEIHQVTTGGMDVTDVDLDRAAENLRKDPRTYLADASQAFGGGLILWRWPADATREVMVPPGHFLLVQSDAPNRVRIEGENRILQSAASFPCGDGRFYALLPPLASCDAFRRYTLQITVFQHPDTRHETVPICFLPALRALSAPMQFSRDELKNGHRLFLSTNGRGAMMRARLRWGELESRYDALLAGNTDSRWPDNRWIMFARCRAWLVYQGYSQEIGIDCLASFRIDPDGSGVWRFHVPTGQGESLVLQIALAMVPGQNAVALRFYREAAKPTGGYLPDDRRIRLILRPDVENRDFHEVTKAYAGPEETWPPCVQPRADGFRFAPGVDRTLDLQLENGRFFSQPEWQYMVHRAMDADRGMDADSDLFSPGYFEAELLGNEATTLLAAMGNDFPAAAAVGSIFHDPPGSRDGKPDPWPLEKILERSLDAYIVKRGDGHSVVAGYPWFLDWGRDSMIFVRCLIQQGRLQEAESILGQFGRHEDGGTLPNMIAGGQAANRDTSDGPLWFVKACSELVDAGGNDFLDRTFGGRTVKEVALSIGRCYVRGTRNGIRVDPDTGLVFSPSHFTWMDTNHPAGSPREGYPIEIQALWHAALCFFARIDSGEDQWVLLADRVRASVTRLFVRPEISWMVDCLHASPGTGAAAAAPDDALRPNQLFALTLDLVDDAPVRRRVMDACLELLVPGGLRSLADRRVARPIEIRHQGNLLGDPHAPYRGCYRGDEDTSRKPGYHNGTAWAWLLPVFCEAWAETYGDPGKPAALAWLSSVVPLIGEGCAGHLPEILDGDRPHRQRGCDAQAWSVSEALRVYLKLQEKAEPGIAAQTEIFTKPSRLTRKKSEFRRLRKKPEIKAC